MTVQDIYNAVDEAAAFSTQMDFDNAGLLVGDPKANVISALVALDVTDAVIDEALSRGSNLIVTHHPVIFHVIKKVTSDMLVYRLIRENISVICAHTNLDLACGGVNDILAQKLDLQDIALVPPENLLRVGKLSRGMTPPEFAYYVKQKLDLPALRYCDGGAVIEQVAVCGGSGGSELREVWKTGCQAYVTADIKHDVMLEAIHLGITLIDGGHFETENHVIEYLAKLVRDTGTETVIARANIAPSVTI